MRRILALVGLASAVLAVSELSVPARVGAFSLTGESLGLDQRAFRVFNNFPNPEANDNLVEEANFPGATGATLAIWKAHAEWGSGPRGGNGLGDGVPSNPNLGDGGANFDQSFQGLASLPGSTNDNTHSAIPVGGGVIAFTELPVSDGWRIRFNSDLDWDDGPGAPGPGLFDIQGVATREIGFTLGLGLSSVAGATMGPYGPGDLTARRSIEADDIAGVQAIYGVASATKPRIDALAGSTAVGEVLEIVGVNFANVGNEVWFTDLAATGEPLKVVGVPATAGGTSIAVVVPEGAADGDVLVKVPGVTAAALSNSFPIDVGVQTPFVWLGPGLAGAAGTPSLTGDGNLGPGSAAGFQLVTTDAPSSAPIALLVGPASGLLPLKGGLLYPFPVLLNVSLGATSPAGGFALVSQIPLGTPNGLQIVVQQWFVDATAPQGYAATNGLALNVP